MQHINFGRIDNLRIVNGDPIFDPPPRVIREVKFGGENGPRSEAGKDDFVLKEKVVEMFGDFDRLRNGTVEVLEVKHGLPFRMLILESGN
jgi:hypothetical protein